MLKISEKDEQAEGGDVAQGEEAFGVKSLS
jgi:hypothetical protein